MDERTKYRAHEVCLPSHHPDDEDVLVQLEGVHLIDGRALHCAEDIRERKAARDRERELRRKIVLASSRGRKGTPKSFLVMLERLFAATDTEAGLAQQAFQQAANPNDPKIVEAREHLERLRLLVERAGTAARSTPPPEWRLTRIYQRAPLLPLLTESIRLCRLRTRELEATIRAYCDISGEVLVDQGALMSIVTSVLVNSITRLTPTHHDRSLSVTASPEAGQLVVRVSDTALPQSLLTLDELLQSRALEDARTLAEECAGSLTGAVLGGTRGTVFTLELPLTPPNGAFMVE